ncbi:MAG: cbb3-type cytochrome c oxidase subunit I [Gammaproteobacteria bacterium]|nr:cbb3-type cytochrome c oxidase subunit I [Gammaproteobacteria bacterium]
MTEAHIENALNDRYVLSTPEDQANSRLSTGWLLLAVGSLVVAGLFTILLVLSRTPYVQDIIPWVDFFHTALVVHVDLTVLVWFLGYAGMFWSLNSTTGCTNCGWAGLFLAILGTAIIVFAPFLGAGGPFMNNYIPVLQDPIFFTGLAIFGLGFLITVLRGLFYARPVGHEISGGGAIRFGLYTALIAGFIAIYALFASWNGIPEGVSGEYYYEMLFWGLGHTLQFVHIQLMLVAWLCLATIAGIFPRLTPRVALILFAIGIIPVVLTPVAYIMFEVGTGNHMQAITWLMQYGGGMAALPVGLVIMYSLITIKTGMPKSSAEANALYFSILLFGVGGVIGFMIHGSNVTVPAHYHGSIVAVTIAFMGITYHLLPRLGFRKPEGRMVRLQPVIYGIGQLMHVTGLAWSGGYGVQRKTAGAEQGLDGIEKIAGMGFMGLGGLIAIIGGIIFLVVVYKSMRRIGQ